jgi:murein DD-endopeptidase MepM/ murein hydrolase activator NlpD
MKYWPVPNSYSKKVPINGNPGSFWEDRGDRRHCGIDIYAPVGSEVVSIANGIVIDIGSFTDSDIIPYWNKTNYVLIKNQDNLIYKYAEMEKIIVKINEFVKVGKSIGFVGNVLNLDKITINSPQYIQEIKKKNISSMIHLEVYSSKPKLTKEYIGGNWFGNKKPKNLLDPNHHI